MRDALRVGGGDGRDGEAGGREHKDARMVATEKALAEMQLLCNALKTDAGSQRKETSRMGAEHASLGANYEFTDARPNSSIASQLGDEAPIVAIPYADVDEMGIDLTDRPYLHYIMPRKQFK